MQPAKRRRISGRRFYDDIKLLSPVKDNGARFPVAVQENAARNH